MLHLHARSIPLLREREKAIFFDICLAQTSLNPLRDLQAYLKLTWARSWSASKQCDLRSSHPSRPSSILGVTSTIFGCAVWLSVPYRRRNKAVETIPVFTEAKWKSYSFWISVTLVYTHRSRKLIIFTSPWRLSTYPCYSLLCELRK